MRMGTTALAVCALACFHANGVAAQGRSMTLADVLARAREQAPQIVSARLALEETRARLIGASLKQQNNPELDAAVGNRNGPTDRFTDFQLGVAQAFEPGARRSARIDGANAAVAESTANIDDVTQSHIHCGPPGVAGPVVVFLFGFVAEGVTVNGRLSEGTITAANVIPRPDSAACPGGIADFDDLLAKMRSGDTYVNVHTIENPPGEIRGQLRCNIPGQGA